MEDDGLGLYPTEQPDYEAQAEVDRRETYACVALAAVAVLCAAAAMVITAAAVFYALMMRFVGMAS